MQQDSYSHRYQDGNPYRNAEGDAHGYAQRNAYGYRHADAHCNASAAAWRRCALTGGGDDTDTLGEPYAVPHALCGACAARDCDCTAGAADVGGPEGAPECRVLTGAGWATIMVVEEGQWNN